MQERRQVEMTDLIRKERQHFEDVVKVKGIKEYLKLRQRVCFPRVATPLHSTLNCPNTVVKSLMRAMTALASPGRCAQLQKTLLGVRAFCNACRRIDLDVLPASSLSYLDDVVEDLTSWIAPVVTCEELHLARINLLGARARVAGGLWNSSVHSTHGHGFMMLWRHVLCILDMVSNRSFDWLACGCAGHAVAALYSGGSGGMDALASCAGSG
eukprot:2529927-Amphidinium_carterae.1